MKATAKNAYGYYIAAGSNHGVYALYDDGGLVDTCVLEDFDAAIEWAKKEAIIMATDFEFAPGIYAFEVRRFDDIGPSMPIDVEVTA
jgi:hypothetical protein